LWVIESFAGCLPFDLLWLDSDDVRGLPLLERKTRLERKRPVKAADASVAPA